MARVLYLSYDGMTDPLGESQVVAYLKRLSQKGHHIDLISYEKPERFEKDKPRIEKILLDAGVNWYPVIYTKKPPVLSTIIDIKKGKRLALSLIKKNNIDIVHCRGYITAMIGLSLKRQDRNLKFVFDMRGWWPDEKVDGGEWSSLYKPVYNYFKSKERQFFNESDHIVSLTQVGKKEIVDQFKILSSKVGVIPTCVDFNVFPEFNLKIREQTRQELGISEDDYVILYSGSVGSNYPPEEILDLYLGIKSKVNVNCKMLFLTKSDHILIEEALIKKSISSQEIIITQSEYRNVHKFIMSSDLGIILYKKSFSLIGRSPTKMGEYWACGVPVISKKGVGDVDGLISKYKNSGFLIEDVSSTSIAVAIEKREICSKDYLRRYSLDYFDIQKGVDFYSKLYDSLV